MPGQAASTCSATHSGLPPFTWRAAWMSGVRSGAEWTMNQRIDRDAVAADARTRLQDVDARLASLMSSHRRRLRHGTVNATDSIPSIGALG